VLWTFSGVYVLTEGNDGRVAIADMALTLDPSGVSVRSRNGEVAWSSPWSRVRELSTAQHSVLPDGRTGLVVVCVEQGGYRHSFVVPTTAPEELDEMMQEAAARHHLRSRQSSGIGTRILTATVVVATTATVTLLVLSAAHVIHF